MASGDQNIVDSGVANSQQKTLRRPPCQHRPPRRSTPLLTQALAWAMQLHEYLSRAEHEAAFCPERLTHLSAQFDRAHARLLDQGLPLRTGQDVRWSRHVYRVVLTEDGLEYQAVG